MPDRPLRFCMITTFYPPYNFGGDGIFVQRLSNELARRGHSVDVIHCIDAYRLGAGQLPSASYDDHPNVTVHGLKSRWGPLSPLATHQTGFPLFKRAPIRTVLKKGFDVIHYHNISLVGGPKILEYGEGIKLYSMLEYWLVCPTNVLFRYNREPCTRRSCFSCSLAYRRPPQWWRYTGLLKAAVEHVDAFIAPSRFSERIHHQMGLNIPVVHIPYFVPPTSSAGSAANAPNGPSSKPYFLFAGRLEKLKGVHTLIPVFRRYPNARLVIAGQGEAEADLRRLAGGSDNIQFAGHASYEQLAGLYRNAVALIVPSICYDASPLVTYEAFTHKTPVIVRNLGGMPEPIHESGGGFIYDTDEELLTAMDRLLDAACRERLGLLGYQALQQRWTAELHVERYLRLVNELAIRRTVESQRPVFKPAELLGGALQ